VRGLVLVALCRVGQEVLRGQSIAHTPATC
jgi:hypothetical protein